MRNPFEIGDTIINVEPLPIGGNTIPKGARFTISDIKNDLVYVRSPLFTEIEGWCHWRFEKTNIQLAFKF